MAQLETVDFTHDYVALSSSWIPRGDQPIDRWYPNSLIKFKAECGGRVPT